jgi:hypothetical protein
MNTTYQKILDSFESTFQNKYILPDSLVRQWFLDAVGEFTLEIDELKFDETLNEFDTKLNQWIISSLGLMMKIKYCTREISRVNKLNNIIGKDISLNSTGDTKKYTKEELDSEISKLTKLLDNQKPTAYV